MSFKRLVHLAGFCLALAAIVLLARQVVALEIWRHPIDFAGLAPLMGLGPVAYVIAVALLALAWRVLLGAEAPLRFTMGGYLTSQLGKYLPGNIGHLAGRHLLFAGKAFSHRRLLAAASAEIALLLCAGALVATLSAPSLLNEAVAKAVLQHSVGWLSHAVVAALAMLLVAVLVGFGRAKAMLALLCYFGFFAISGGILVALVAELSPMADAAGQGWFILGACAIAWLSGFVIPGAPGGLGVREAVLVMLLAPMTGSETALLAALGHRAVTLTGDGLAALCGLALLFDRSVKKTG